jgi:hypothetical protein
VTVGSIASNLSRDSRLVAQDAIQRLDCFAKALVVILAVLFDAT